MSNSLDPDQNQHSDMGPLLKFAKVMRGRQKSPLVWKELNACVDVFSKAIGLNFGSSQKESLTSKLWVWEQQRLWRVCAYAQPLLDNVISTKIIDPF